jgi:hypothetical protein
MAQLIQIFECLQWRQRPLLLAALVLLALYTSLVRIPLNVLRKQCPQDDRRKGLEHMDLGWF